MKNELQTFSFPLKALFNAFKSCSNWICSAYLAILLLIPGSLMASHDPAPVSDFDHLGMGTFSGSYSHSSTDHVWFVFNANAGDVINFSVTTTGWTSYCWLYSAPDNCVEIGESSDNGCLSLFQQNGPGSSTYTFSFTASTGQYAMQLDSYVGGSGSYTVIISGSTATTALCNSCAPSIAVKPPRPITHDQLGRATTYQNTNINGKGRTWDVVTPGSSVTLYSNWNSFYTGGAGCPGCITQHYIGIGGTNIELHCHGAGGGSGTINLTFTAPATPGIYYLTQTATWWYYCDQFGQPGFSNNYKDAIALIVVGCGQTDCPADITVNASTNACGAIVNYAPLASIDANDVSVLQQTSGYASGSLFPIGTTTNTFEANYNPACGSPTTCSFNVTVIDNVAPVISTCAVTRNVAGCNTGAISTPSYNESETGSSYSVFSSSPNNGVGSDNCAVTSVTYKDTKSGTCPTVVTRTWKLTDAAGNSKTCTQQININEPTVNFSCGTSVTMSSCSSSAIGSAYTTFLTSTTGSGGCNGSFTTTAPNNPPGICGGTVTATWTYVTDCSMNSCSRTFTVNAPATVTVTCPQNKNEDLCHTQSEINTSYSNWLNSLMFSGGCNASASNNGGAAPSRFGGSKTVTWTVTSSCQGPVTCSAVFSVSGADDDCDGLGNGCDQCPGGDDKIDNNNDGKPDCKYPPSNISQVINAWKCSSNTKVQVCSKSPGGYKTVCTYLSAVQNHINAGGYLGPCGNSGCGGGNLKQIEKNEFMTGEEVLYQYDLTASDYQGIEVYPNPAQNILYVKVQSNTGNPVELVLYNSFGQKLLVEKHVMNNQLELVIPIGITDYSNGLYFVKVMNGLEQNVKSFTIQK